MCTDLGVSNSDEVRMGKSGVNQASGIGLTWPWGALWGLLGSGRCRLVGHGVT